MIKVREGFIFYDETLPKKNEKIDWKKAIGLSFKIMYDYEIYNIEIIGKYGNMLELKYNDNIEIILSFNLKKCAIGKLINKVTKDFKINIGDNFKDSKRDITVIDRKYEQKLHTDGKSTINDKYYKYKCNKCSWDEGWIVEGDLLTRKRGCSCCASKVVVEDINSIWATDRWMCDLGLSEEDAKTHTRSSGDKVFVVCPECNKKKEITISNIYNHKSIGCSCSDKRSYPEKFMMSALNQLGVEYQMQYKPKYLNRLEEDGKWSQKKSDFYLPNYNLIIETDGGMNHKGGKVHGYSKKSLEYYIEVDNWKDEQHLLHGLRTIRIDCFKSNMEYIKNNILSSELNKLFDLSKIDWLKCEEFSIKSNIIKEVCDYWNENSERVFASDLCEIFKLSKDTIIDYLKLGTELNWCNYNPKEEMRRKGKNGRNRRKNIKTPQNNKMYHAERLNE